MPNNNSLLRNILVLVMGSGTAKLIGFASVLVLTRLYTPEQFGMFNVYLSLVLLIGPLVALRYPLAIPLPRTNIAASNLLILCVSLAAVLSCCVFLLFNYAKPLQQLLSLSSFDSTFFIILSISIFIYSIHEILVSWNIRNKSFKKVAIAEALVSFSAAIVKISIPFIGLGITFGLVYGHILGVLLGFLFLLISLKINSTAVTRVSMKRVAKMYSDFPKFRLPSQFLMILSAQLPILVFNHYFGKAETGQLGLAISVIAVPMMLIANTASQAYHGEVAKIGKKKPDEIYKVSLNLCKKMALIGIVPALFLTITGKYLFAFFFGEIWSDAGVFASILSVMLFFQFIANPIGHALSVFKRNDLFLILNFMRACMVVSCFLMGSWLTFTPFELILLYSIALGTFYVMYAIFVLIFLKKESKRIAKS
ncbi:lipopolysaccharide biosynthesis protein [Glaciecola petra]|uniref:Polysaccharide biosynthesis protein n=1 Tax=Glaciecola petra TaxID=3075602 RepID=A0ABU2ZV84_9ALTE|nr:hypothetical protein [Aestuariibacter sp. P117]MDT0595943.1 hypothetical protein [Aestuariibacter sp. P117]